VKDEISVGSISPSFMSQTEMHQVRVKGTVVNATTTLDGMIIVLMDLDGNLIHIHTSGIHVYIEEFG
jgi:hypothetical protein